jgi:hypothetical protein
MRPVTTNSPPAVPEGCFVRRARVSARNGHNGYAPPGLAAIELIRTTISECSTG